MACGAVGHRRHDEPVADEIPELNLQRLTDELEAAVELAAALPYAGTLLKDESDLSTFVN